MEKSRLDAAVDLLKQSKAQGKTYQEATQILQQQGYSTAEIEQASYRFPYSDVLLTDFSHTPTHGNLDQVFAKAVKTGVAQRYLIGTVWGKTYRTIFWH